MKYSKVLSLGLFIFLLVGSKVSLAGGIVIINKTNKKLVISWTMDSVTRGVFEDSMDIAPNSSASSYDIVGFYKNVHIESSNGHSVSKFRDKISYKIADDVVFRGKDGKDYEEFSTGPAIWDVDVIDKQ